LLVVMEFVGQSSLQSIVEDHPEILTPDYTLRCPFIEYC
jgi:hypothetical protein